VIDTHCHCLYGVDDASEDIDTSIEMLREAYEDGITKIICTPHSLPGGKYPNDYEALQLPFNQLKKAIQELGIEIDLYLGSETFFSPLTIAWGKAGKLVSLNQTSRILLEFPWYEIDFNFDPLLAIKQMKELGYQIIVAHPERYPFIHKDYSYMKELRALGCHFQVNSTSLMYPEDRNYELAWKIVEDGFVDVIASDAHRPHSKRSIILSGCHKLIMGKYGTEEANRLFIENPQALIDGGELKIK